jgi:hypothetical protein
MLAGEFYKRFEAMPAHQRFELIQFKSQPTSFFVIFQKLSEVRKQQKYFEQQEIHLLRQAEEAFNKMEKDGNSSK